MNNGPRVFDGMVGGVDTAESFACGGKRILKDLQQFTRCSIMVSGQDNGKLKTTEIGFYGRKEAIEAAKTELQNYLLMYGYFKQQPELLDFTCEVMKHAC
ncbi:hypothetical protein BDZ45DRAFT_748786 [Acephala macrosclerotiorum]|nr:hypothetical protein BDZ45DRAFT_748786 [Acephala macrosclerotiorum]